MNGECKPDRQKVDIQIFSSERLPNPHLGSVLPWQIYQDVRNGIIEVCRKYGRVGPVGKCVITSNIDGPNWQDWEKGDADPQYYVMNDQYGHDCYIFVEIYGENLSTENWISSIRSFLTGHKGWGICISNIPGNYIIIFADRIMVRGPSMAKCKSVSELSARINIFFKTESLWRRIVSKIFRRHPG